jgi:O-acetyl-ADP-ribose deacetylase (regulator of RNase III)
MKIFHGDILNNVSDGIILQSVNAQGVMGSGFAKAIRNKWPVVWKEYSEWCQPNPTLMESRSRLGLSLIIEVEVDKLFVANIIGQQFFYKPGDLKSTRYTSYDAIDTALKDLSIVLDGCDISIHFPLIGAGLGGGHWPVIKEIINHRLRSFDLTLWLLPGMQEPK